MKNIGYSEFVKICGIFEPDTWSDWLSVKYDGVYIKPPASDIYLTPEERSILTEHPTYDLTKPALSFPCSLEELRAFDEYQRLGLDLDGAYEDGQKAAPASELVTPAAALNLPPTDEVPELWPLKQPQRLDRLADAIHAVLKDAHDAKGPIPFVRDVMALCIKKRPHDVIEVTYDEIKFYGSDGNVKMANIDNVRKRIERMTSS
jgi:hypothetical protein